MKIEALAKSIVAFMVSLAVCAHPAASDAVPLVSGVQGTATNGLAITVNGSGFGSSGPNVVLYDDFENGTNGTAIRTGAGSAQVGSWSQNARPDNSRAIYSSVAKVSGNLAFRADQQDSWPNGQPYLQTILPDGVTDTFISWWMYIPATDNIPGEGTQDGTNWKTIWMFGPGGVYTPNDQTLPTILGVPPNAAPYYCCDDCLFAQWLELSFAKGRWQRVWNWFKGGSSGNGAVLYWELTPTGVMQRINANNVSNLYSGGTHKLIHINGYGRATPNSHPTFDDIYIAVGANAQARVEIGNKSTYTACTNLTITTPTSWSDSQVSAVMRQGSFTNGQAAYVYVFNASGAVNAQGYPITIGGGAGDPPPSAPRNLRFP